MQQRHSHTLLGKTLVHGDPHAKNIFFDEEYNKLYWIDLERLGKSLFKPTSPIVDFAYILLFPFLDFPWSYVFEMNIKREKLHLEAWFKDFYTPFINAYLDTFGGNKAQLAREMKYLLHSKSNNWWHDRGKFLLPYLDPILDDIITQN